MRLPVSVIVLTKNEQKDLPTCLASIGWCDDVHVLDSGSTDHTVAIAEAAGAFCYYHPFTSFGAQRNWALDHCLLKHDWILFLDADEQATPAFEQALRQALSDPDPQTAGYYCCWKMMLDGRWLKRADSFPKWQLRLLLQGRVRFVDFGHGQKEGEVHGRIEYLKEPYLHHAFSKGWTHWLNRHNRYSSEEATERLKSHVRWQTVFSTASSKRNKALKPLVSRLPGWPLAYFLFLYVLKLGLLEGRPGLVYCINMAYYEFLIQIKMYEIEQLKIGDRP